MDDFISSRCDIFTICAPFAVKTIFMIQNTEWYLMVMVNDLFFSYPM